MNTQGDVFQLHRGHRPLLVSVPHVGTAIPPQIASKLVPRALDTEDADWHLQRLYAFAVEIGASLIVPRFARYVVDLNRPPDNAPMYAKANNTELCPTRFFTGEPLYREGQAPDEAEVQRRVARYWRPYHDALAGELQRLHAEHGVVALFDGHSIQPELPWLFEGRLPDLNLGTAEGKSCSPALRDALSRVLQAHTTHSHVIDGRFKGGYITRHYGRPAEGFHAVQMEMGWQCVMDPARPPAQAYDEARAATVLPVLKALTAALLDAPSLAPSPAGGRGGKSLWAPSAWVDGRWRGAVLLEIDTDGRWSAITPDQPAPPHAEALSGPALPGLVNAHSHAFQRAFAGLAERRDNEHDDFWSWRDRMYGVALRITPDELRAVATRLYSDLLQGGYTHVCEFHYLHHAPDGTPYADPLAMCEALALAAQDAGIGLTLLPVLYERAGFAQPALREDQRRFRTDVHSVLALRDGIRAARWPGVDAGVAIHSLRAAAAGSIHALRAALEGDAGPIHIHVAEQTAEVTDCLSATGHRPIEWLAHEGLLDARWQLVHATHATPQEIDAVARSGAGVVLCPTTEANLGDGIPDLPRWLASNTPLSIGSDSQVGTDWPEELRWLEYTQRLIQRRRNVAAAPGRQPATAARLFDAALAGGAAAAGWQRAGFQVGARADLLELAGADTTAALAPEHTLDGLVFAPRPQPFARTMVAGNWLATPPGA